SEHVEVPDVEFIRGEHRVSEADERHGVWSGTRSGTDRRKGEAGEPRQRCKPREHGKSRQWREPRELGEPREVSERREQREAGELGECRERREPGESGESGEAGEPKLGREHEEEW